MIADVLADWSNLVLIDHNGLADLFRFVIAILATLTGALLSRLYRTHRTGKMNHLAGIGAVSTYFVVAWAQVVAIGGPTDQVSALNVGVLLAVSLSLAGTLKAMNVGLFR